MALDKNYIDVEDDSLALVAWNYYKKRPLSRERMLSAYSLGRVQLNKQDYIASMLSFRRSLEDARQLVDAHYEGLSLRNIAVVYDQTYDIVHSLEYMREAYTIFHGSGEQLYADYAKLSIALTYLNMRDVHSCDSVLRKLKNVSDDNIQFQVNKAYMDVMYSLTPPDAEGVLRYYRLAKEYKYSQFSAKEYTTVGTAFGLLNQPDSMRYYWEKAASEAASEEDRIAAIYDQYVVDSSEGQYERALSSLKTAVAFQDSLVNEKLRQSVSYALGELYGRDAREVALQKKNLLSLLIIILLLCLLVSGYFITKSRRQRIELEESLVRVSDVEEELQRMKTNQEGIAYSVEALVHDKVKYLKSLSDLYFRFENKVANREYSTREEVIESFRRDLRAFRNNKEYLVALETKLNMQKDNMIAKMREGFAVKKNKGELLREEDWTILIMVFSGFSVKTISFFTGLPVSTIGMRKTRYTEKIAGLDIPEAAVYAEEYAKCFRVRSC
jgi:tetratricopeptide (TPR) repeat protein